MTVLVAPARYVLTAAHIRHDSEDRTLCGRPLAADELWTEVQPDPEVPVCRGCQHAARKAAERAESAQESPGEPGRCQGMAGSAQAASEPRYVNGATVDEDTRDDRWRDATT